MMKMWSLERTKTSRGGRRPKRFSSRALWLVAIAILCYFGSYSFSWLNDAAIFLARPLWQAERALGRTLDRLTLAWQSKVKLATENDLLTARARALEAYQASYLLLAAENRRLREVLGRGDQAVAPSIARVLTAPVGFPYGVLLIDLGRENSSRELKLGDQVRVAGEILLGRLVEINQSSAKVQLAAAAGEVTPVVIGTDNLAAIATGLGGGNFSLTLPRGINITEGELIKVVLGGEELLLGTVAKIMAAPSDPFQEIIFKSPVNVNEIREVEIYSH